MCCFASAPNKRRDMRNPTDLAVEICKAANVDAETISDAQYIKLLEGVFEEVSDFLENADSYVRKNLQKLDDAGVRDLRKRLAFPEGTVVTLPQDGDLVVHVRGLSDAEQDRLVKSLDRKVVGTSKQGLARVAKGGEIDPASVQGPDEFDAIDRLIQLTAQAIEKRQANPDDVRGKTQLGWRLT